MNTRYTSAAIKDGGYTGYGHAGSRNQEARYISVTEVGKNLREALKEKYPECKFSITGHKYSMGQSITISLMSAPYEVFNKPDGDIAGLRHGHINWSVEEILKIWQDIVDKGHEQVNHFYIKDSYILTDKAKEIMEFVKKEANSYNYDDSDGMIDYFQTNFYLNLHIGKWYKPFIKI